MEFGKVGSSPTPARQSQQVESSQVVEHNQQNTQAESVPQRDASAGSVTEAERRNRMQEAAFQGQVRRMEMDRSTSVAPGQDIRSQGLDLELINDPVTPQTHVATLSRGIDAAHDLLGRATQGTIGGLGARNPGRETQQANELIHGAVGNIRSSADYHALPAESRSRLWQSILLTGNNREGQTLLQQLGSGARQGIQDMQNAQDVLGRRFPEVQGIIHQDAESISRGDIQNGIENARQSLFEPALLTQFSRDLHIGSSWNDQVRQGRQSMQRVAESILQRGPDSYFGLPQQQREQVWQNILMSQDTATGQRLMGALGNRALSDLDSASRTMSQQARGFSQTTLNAQTESIRNAARDARAVEIEAAAAAAGDPVPRRPSQEAVERYVRLTSDAYTRAQLAGASEGAQRPLLHAFMSFMGGVPNEPTGGGIARSGGEWAAQQLNQNMEGPLFALSFAQNLGTASETYDNLATPEGRMRHALRQVALQEAGGNEGRQQQIMAELTQTGAQLNAGLSWLQRHPDHPSNQPAGIYQGTNR